MPKKQSGVVVSNLEKLKTTFLKSKLSGKLEEIYFFREIKPRFAAQLIFFNEMYNIETTLIPGTLKQKQRHYKAALAKLTTCFRENLEFYKYYRSGNHCLDDKYFVRGRYDVRLTLDSFYFQADRRFSPSHDYKVARILANELIKAYVEKRLSDLKPHQGNAVQAINHSQKWTGSKVPLTELIYALHAEGAFNNGASELKDITTFFESAFQIDLGHYHRTFLDIRSRNTERTKFLSTLRDKLILRMDNADEY